MRGIIFFVGMILLLIAGIAGLVFGISLMIDGVTSDVGDSGEHVEDNVNVEWVTVARDMYRIVDYDAQVVCYRLGGLHCLPLSDTALPRE